MIQHCELVASPSRRGTPPPLTCSLHCVRVLPCCFSVFLAAHCKVPPPGLSPADAKAYERGRRRLKGALRDAQQLFASWDATSGKGKKNKLDDNDDPHLNDEWSQFYTN